jgi:hypothetical protein
MPLERTGGSRQAPSIDCFLAAPISHPWTMYGFARKLSSRFYHRNPASTSGLTLRRNMKCPKIIENKWRKRVGVEPTDDG